MSPVLAGLAVAAAFLVARAGLRSAPQRLRAVVAGPARGGSAAAVPAAHRAVRVGTLPTLVAGAVLLGIPLVIVTTVAGGGLLGRTLLRRARSRRLVADRKAAVVELTYALAAELRAGHPPAAALAAASTVAGPLQPDLASIAALAATGEPAADGLQRLSAEAGCGHLAAVAAAWQVTERVGGPIADVLDRLGQGLDADTDAERAIAVTLAGPRATMLLLAVLPAFGVLLGESLGGSPLTLLLHRPLGWALLAGAAVLDSLGLAWISSLVRSIDRP